MLNKFEYSLPRELKSALDKEAADWQAENKIGRIWNKDSTVWTGSDEDKWLGWLEIVESELDDAEKFASFRTEIENSEFEHIVLLGMGGSSLCPEVLGVTFGESHFRILDSTVPAQIKALQSNIDVAKTLFIVASKSGSTLEPNTFKQYFHRLVSDTVGEENAGRHFVAITDPGSKLEALAKDEGFRKIFYGEPSVGGRFSALSVFGMIPAAAMGLDSIDILMRSMEMVHASKSHLPNENPGALLGLILGICHKAGRDKLTIFTSPEIYDVGAWLEQLIAESTGKQGVAIIPVDRERHLRAEDYDDDRVFAYLKLSGSSDKATDEKAQHLGNIGFPTVTIEIEELENLGQEFFRWEFATAVAGSVMGINPFDQPDVEAAKVEARKLTEAYEESGKLPGEEPIFEDHGISLFTSPEYAASLNKLVGNERSLARYLDSHIEHIQEYDYFAVLGYIEMNPDNERLLTKIREYVLLRELCATCLGFGPRFLHSTGQAYKGGANNGVFLQITSDDRDDMVVPGQEYTFGVVKSAQARGDFQVLVDRDRRALRVHLGENVTQGLERIISALA